jgi:tetratricopeptide (TPR) repeat protein
LSGAEPAGILPRISVFFLILLVCFGVASSPPLFAQQHAQQPKRSAVAPRKHPDDVAKSQPLTAELQSRFERLESAKQSDDPVAITSASKSVLGLGLREIGGLDLILDSVPPAVDAIKRSLDFEDAPATRIDLAQAYLHAQRLDESLSLVTDVLVADPQNARAWYVQGKLWIRKQRYDNAAESFKNALNLQDDPAAAYLLGATLLQLKDRNSAEAIFRKLADNPTNRGNIHVLLADAYHAANYMDDFHRESRLAGVSMKPAAAAPSSMNAVVTHAAQLGSGFETAKPTAQEHRQIERMQIKLRTVLGTALNDLGTAEARQEQYSLALAHFHEAASWNPDVPGLMRNTGIAAARVEDYPECIRALRPVLAANPQDNVARAMLGTALFATRSYADAVQVFTPLGDSALQLHELAYSWAASLVHLNKYAEATALLNKLEQQPISTDTLMLVAQLWSQMGNYEHSVEVCHRALQLDPKLPGAHYFAGVALIHLNRSAEAAQEFRSELQLAPDDTDAQFHLAFNLLQLSQNEQAVELLRTVVARDPDHAEANYELGKELHREGKSGEALDYLEAAVRLRPEFAPGHYQLQSAYRELGRKDDANREAKIYRALKAKSRNITLPPPREPKPGPASN